jgi:HNH endonuclease
LKNLPSIEDLEEIFEIDPSTGSIKWKKRGKARKIGIEAGVIRRSANRIPYRYISLGKPPDRIFLPASWVIWAVVNRRWPNHEIDHKNRDSLDNRIENLRPATDGQQVINQVRDNRNGFKWVKKIVMANGQIVYRGTVVTKGKKFYTPRYATPEEAHSAARSIAQQIHGEFFNPGASGGGGSEP